MSRYININSQSSLPIGESTTGFLKTAGGYLNNTWLIVGSVILFVVLGIFVYFYFVAPRLNAQFHANKEHNSSDGESNKSAELLFFFADWCPHCKAAKPIWNDLKSEYQNKTINGYQVVFTEIDCSEETAEVDQMMNKYNVEGYPTIKLLKDGQVIEYDAKPSKQTLTEFLNTVL
jgi:thiol-disulfide isomerase/thioredoxin